MAVHSLPVLPNAAELALASAFALLLMWRVSALRWWLLVVSLTALMVISRAHGGLDARLTPAMEGVDYAVVGQISSLVTRFEHGRRFDFRISHCVNTAPFCPAGRKVRLSWYGRTPHLLHAGQHWQLNVRLKRPHGLVNPGGFDAELRALQSGTDGYGYVRKKRRQEPPNNWRPVRLIRDGGFSLAATIAAARDAVQLAMQRGLGKVDPTVSGTLIALVTGNQSAIPAGMWDIYNRTGTSHLMSISGLHVTMFAALAVGLSRFLLRNSRLVPLLVLRRFAAPHIAWFCGLVAALAYSAFSGWGIPAQRTCWMLAAAGGVLLSGRHCSLPFVLALAAAIVVVIDPWAPLSAGFWLSFVAVIAIIVYAHGWLENGRVFLQAAARTQWAATIALLPLGAVWFGSVSVVSPVANAVAIPVVSIVLTPLAMVAGFISVWWPSGGDVLLALAAGITYYLLLFLSWAGASSQAIWITGHPSPWVLALPALGAGLILWPAAPVPRVVAAGLLMPLLLLPAAASVDGRFRLVALDVGQGSAVLIQTARHSLLFDTGPTYDADSGAGDRLVAPLLRSRQIRRLDTVVLSHADADHIGGAHRLIDQFNPSQVLSSMPSDSPKAHRLPKMQLCRRGDSWQWDGVQFSILHPGALVLGNKRSNRNARSCVLHVKGRGGSVLLTGDIEAAQEKTLVAVYGNAGLNADVLIAPHHGSGTSSTTQFLATVNPRFAVFQMGYRNRFRHPAHRVLRRYQQRAIDVLRSDVDGAVEIDFSPGTGIQLIRHRQVNKPYWRLPVFPAPPGEVD
ncbi:MAG: DNA internalization-related competence protein ComEC/Rec2 [Burkholderiaceae bacterium]